MADAEELSPADVARLCSTMRDWLLAGRSNVYKLDELMEALRAAGLQFPRHAVIKVCVQPDAFLHIRLPSRHQVDASNERPNGCGCLLERDGRLLN